MLPFCQPDTLETVAENLGEVLRGDKIMNSNYELKMGVEETCKVLCRKELTGADVKLFSTRCVPCPIAPSPGCPQRLPCRLAVAVTGRFGSWHAEMRSSLMKTAGMCESGSAACRHRCDAPPTLLLTLCPISLFVGLRRTTACIG